MADGYNHVTSTAK